MVKKHIVSAQVSQSIDEHIQALVVAWSDKLGREVRKSDVIRTLLAKGLEEHPVDDEMRARARAKPVRQRGGTAPELRLVQLEGGMPVGYDVPKGIRHHTLTLGTVADITRLRRAA